MEKLNGAAVLEKEYAISELQSSCFVNSAHFQEHFIRIGNGQGFFNQAMLNQNAMIRGCCRCRWMGLPSGSAVRKPSTV